MAQIFENSDIQGYVYAYLDPPSLLYVSFLQKSDEGSIHITIKIVCGQRCRHIIYGVLALYAVGGKGGGVSKV